MHWKLETKIISNKLIIMPYDFCRDLRYLLFLSNTIQLFFPYLDSDKWFHLILGKYNHR